MVRAAYDSRQTCASAQFLEAGLQWPRLSMSKRNHPHHKIDRRLRCNLWGRPKSPFNKRDYGPGEHGRRRKSKPSNFAEQLMAKQQLKGYYGNISERQFRRYYLRATQMRGDTGEQLVGLLESRLDAIVYRLNFVPTVFAARQVISHGHISVNGKRVTIPSYACREGDVVSIREHSRNHPVMLEAIQDQERDLPEYIGFDEKNLSGTYSRVPKLDDVPYPVRMNPQLVIEYYSR